MRIGYKMQQVAEFVKANEGCLMIEVAREVGPHGSLRYGYAAIHRAIGAGLVVRREGKRRGTYTLHIEGEIVHDYCADLGEVDVSFDMDVEVVSVWGDSRDMPGGCEFFAAIDFATAIVHLPEDEKCKLSDHPDCVRLTEQLKEWAESYVVDNLSDFATTAYYNEVKGDWNEYNKFRGVYWMSVDGQRSVLLTGEEHSLMTDEGLLEAAILYANEVGLEYTEDQLVISNECRS